MLPIRSWASASHHYFPDLRCKDGQRTLREIILHLVLALEDLGLHDVLVIIVERQRSGEQTEEDDTKRPDVDLCALVNRLARVREGRLMRTLAQILATGQHLRRCVARRTTERLHELPRLEFPAEAKVCDLDVASLVEEDVCADAENVFRGRSTTTGHTLQLEIAMHDALGMNVRDAQAKLTEYPPRFGIAESLMFDEVVKEFSSRA